MEYSNNKDQKIKKNNTQDKAKRRVCIETPKDHNISNRTTTRRTDIILLYAQQKLLADQQNQKTKQNNKKSNAIVAYKPNKQPNRSYQKQTEWLRAFGHSCFKLSKAKKKTKTREK